MPFLHFSCAVSSLLCRSKASGSVSFGMLCNLPAHLGSATLGPVVVVQGQAIPIACGEPRTEQPLCCLSSAVGCSPLLETINMFSRTTHISSSSRAANPLTLGPKPNLAKTCTGHGANARLPAPVLGACSGPWGFKGDVTMCKIAPNSGGAGSRGARGWVLMEGEEACARALGSNLCP